MRILLDTNAFSEFRQGNRRIIDRLKDASGIAFSTVVAGELIYGYRGGNRFEANRRALEEFLTDTLVHVLPVTLETANHFGRIRADLKRRGRPIPVNDVWIAAHVFESGSELVTFDRHFEAVPGLAMCLITT